MAFAAGTFIDLLDVRLDVRRAARLARLPGGRRMARAATRTVDRCDDQACDCAALAPAASARARLFALSDPVGKLRDGVRFALDMLRELGGWIVMGVLLGAATQTLVPARLFAHYLGGVSIVGLLAALLVAGLFSADSLGSLPWVESLLTKGLGVGSAMTLLVAGVGTNVSTLGPVAREMGQRTAIVYAVSVVVLAACVGLVLNLVL